MSEQRIVKLTNKGVHPVDGCFARSPFNDHGVGGVVQGGHDATSRAGALSEHLLLMIACSTRDGMPNRRPRFPLGWNRIGSRPAATSVAFQRSSVDRDT